MLRLARPQKTGLDYFPVDVDIFSDTKIRIVMARFGADGFAFYMYLLSRIYRDGFCVKADEDFILIASADLQMSREKIGQMLSFFLDRSLLDSILFKADKILTSSGIQKRYQEAVKSRASKNAVTVDGRYWLLKTDETESFIQVRQPESFSEKKPNKSEKNPSKSENNPLKESKGKKSKGEERKAPASLSPAEQREELERKYGITLVEVYLAKAGKYRYEGDKAIEKAAQWLTEDEARGKITALPPKEETSLDMEGYMAQVMTCAPKYRKDDGV